MHSSFDGTLFTIPQTMRVKKRLVDKIGLFHSDLIPVKANMFADI